MATNGRAINHRHSEDGSGGEGIFPTVSMKLEKMGFIEDERDAAVGWICRRILVVASVRSHPLRGFGRSHSDGSFSEIQIL